MHSAFVAVTLILFLRNPKNLPCKNRIGFQIVQHFDFGISCTAAKIFLGNAPEVFIFGNPMLPVFGNRRFGIAVQPCCFHHGRVILIAVIQVNSGGNAFDSAGMAVLPDAVFILEIGFRNTCVCHPYSIAFHEVGCKYGFRKYLAASYFSGAKSFTKLPAVLLDIPVPYMI